MNIEIFLSGFLYLLILVLQIVMAIFGYILEPTPKHYESDAKLLNFSKNPEKFKLSIAFALIEHFCVIILPIMLFIAFSSYNIILGIVWMVFRIAEGSIQVYNEKDYWGLLDLAKKYSDTSGAKKDSLFDSYRITLKRKSSRFAFAMICWAIGTLAISIMLVTYGVTPPFIGWLGIAASIAIGFANVAKLLKPNFKVYETLSSIFGILSIVFEIMIGGWLIFYSFIIL
ncbi:MAG: DUF4386 domain-containing protein [Candidatus Lokiarchaeota archaeon]|nr:DUF4386 domain-containing protein [Candidatus Lokiarchaeota archaeon]